MRCIILVACSRGLVAADYSIPSPCVGACALDAHGYCIGCQRTGREIAGWTGMDEGERRRLMDEVLPAREAALR